MVNDATTTERASPDSAHPKRGGKGKSPRFSAAFWNVVLQSCVPLVVLVVLLVDWLVATVSLGHPPRPMYDDPKTIPALSATWLYHGTIVLLFVTPGSFLVALIAAPIAFAQLVRRRDVFLQVKLLPLLLPTVTWTIFIAAVAFDPLRIIPWLAD